jgi:hypothetical protein
LEGQTTPDAHPASQALRLPIPKSPRTSAIRGRSRSYVPVCMYVCRQRSYPLWPPERGLAGHACRSDKDLPLISSGIVAGPSRLNKPIGWPRKAGSTSSAPCSPLALWHFSTLCCALAAGIHVQASHLVEPAGRPAKESQRSQEKAVLRRSGDDGTQSRRECSSRTPPGAATDSCGGFDNNWLVASMTCKQCTLAAEHAAGNRCTNRLPTEQIRYAAMQGTYRRCAVDCNSSRLNPPSATLCTTRSILLVSDLDALYRSRRGVATGKQS